MLSEMGTIERLRLEGLAASALLAGMQTRTVKVRRLVLRAAAEWKAPWANALARGLEVNTTITELDISDNTIPAAGMRCIASALRSSATLRRLDLRDITTNDVGAVLALADALEANVSLEWLRVRTFTGNVEALLALLASIGSHPKLTDVSLSGTAVDDKAAHAISEMLRATNSLHRLQIGDEKFFYRGGQIAATWLRHTGPLTHLYLQSLCGAVGDAGASQLAAALSHSSCSLVLLNLYDCNIGVDGGAALAGALRTNRTLTALNVGANKGIGDKGALLLFDALKTNSALAALCLSSCSITDPGPVDEALEANRTLAVLDISCNRGLHEVGAAPGQRGCALVALCRDDLRPRREGLPFRRGRQPALRSVPSPYVTRWLTPARSSEHERQREASAAQRDFLRSAAAFAAVPWIAEDVLVNIVSEYADTGWSDFELELYERTGSHFFGSWASLWHFS